LYYELTYFAKSYFAKSQITNSDFMGLTSSRITGLATFIIISLVNSVVVQQHPNRHMPLVLRASLAGWASLVIQIQEFHDVEGDLIAGKRTLPLVLGEAKVWLMRYATCWVFFTTHALFLLWGFVLA
jgi:4-hydroxybenzoate polyprenyltransferase